MPFIIFTVIFFACVIYLFYKSIKMNRERIKKQLELNNKYNATISGSIQHCEGLQIPKGVFVNLYYSDDKITFVKDRWEMSLALSKIISMDIINGNNIHDQAAGAIAGGLLLGGLSGAVSGSLVATKNYFIISYESDYENKSIIFDNSSGELSGNKLDVFVLINDFKAKYNRETKRIEL